MLATASFVPLRDISGRDRHARRPASTSTGSAAGRIRADTVTSGPVRDLTMGQHRDQAGPSHLTSSEHGRDGMGEGAKRAELAKHREGGDLNESCNHMAEVSGARGRSRLLEGRYAIYGEYRSSGDRSMEDRRTGKGSRGRE